MLFPKANTSNIIYHNTCNNFKNHQGIEKIILCGRYSSMTYSKIPLSVCNYPRDLVSLKNHLYTLTTILIHKLTCPVQRPTTRSAMVVSSVSPDLWDTITPQPFCCESLHASIASVTEPIWFTLSKRQLQAFWSMAYQKYKRTIGKSVPIVKVDDSAQYWNQSDSPNVSYFTVTCSFLNKTVRLLT